MQTEIKILNESGADAFPDATVLNFSKDQKCRYLSHTLEDGSVVTDHVVQDPVTATLELHLGGDNYKNTYQLIKRAYMKADEFIIQTRVDRLENMHITGMPHEETSDMYDSVIIVLSFKQLTFIQPQYGRLSPADVWNPAHTDQVMVGEKKGQQPRPQTLAKKLFF